MRTRRLVRIVLCSPGDVTDEHRVMESVIDELNRGIADELNVTIKLSRWETDAHPGFHPEGPQGIIDPILKIEECDVVLGIFWKRFGTPTRDARSGTEHELRKAIECHKQRRRPQVMIYFKEKEIGTPMKLCVSSFLRLCCGFFSWHDRPALTHRVHCTTSLPWHRAGANLP